MASWPNDGVVRVIDRATGDAVTEIELPAAFGVAFSPDGQQIALASNEQASARVVDADSGQQLFTLDGHDGGIFRVRWSPDGRWIATGGGGDTPVRIWDARDRRAAVHDHQPHVTGQQSRLEPGLHPPGDRER